MKNLWVFSFIAGALVFGVIKPGIANADLVVSVGGIDGQGTLQAFNAGTRATLYVSVFDDSPASPLSMNTYSLAFRIGNTSTIPAEFPRGSFAVGFAGGLIPTAPPFGFGLETDPSVISADVIPGHNIVVSNDQGLTETSVSGSSSSKSRLFSISFDISAATSTGVYGITFEPNASQFFGPVNVVGGLGFPEDLKAIANTPGTFFNQFEVTAVPEPTSMALFGLGITAFLTRRRHGNVRSVLQNAKTF